ncbi:MAG: DUF4388 domain-containing protein [Myxococcota bacterium]
MSLIGSLEDLGLGDILQIISLSQKSGVLVIRSDHGEGRIVFLDGLVRGAVVKGGPSDLRGVLVGGGLLSEDDFTAGERAAAERGVSVAEAIVADTAVTSEQLETRQREVVEDAVAQMFSWRVGEFSFDVRDQPDPEDPPSFVPAGINAQYLAMECSRLGDEAGRGAEPDDAEGPELSAHEMFGVSPDEADDPVEVAVETIAVSTLAASDPFSAGSSPEAGSAVGTAPAEELVADLVPADPVADADTLALAEPIPDGVADGVAIAELEPEAAPVSAEVVAVADGSADPEDPPACAGPWPPLVVIGPELPVLEWVKDSVGDAPSQVHIFQRGDLGLSRIRQYLVRGTLPTVLVAPETPGDPLSGIPDATDFVRRLKGQAERMTVYWLDAADAEPRESASPADGRVVRPAAYQLNNSGAAHQREALSDELRGQLAAAASRPAAARDGRETISPAALERLKRATAHLREASTRGEVLPLVIRFASESFSRTAMFAVLDGSVIGMAGHGLGLAGGPDDDVLRRIRLDAADSAWITRVLETRTALRGAPENEGDRALAAALGDPAPPEVYLAPIESAGQVVALLYGDNLPEGRPLPETSALEVVLHHAGLALDRAALERALAETER